MRWALDPDELRSIEIGLRSKLRSGQLSENFIDRHSEDLVQQAVAEYAKARERGDKVTNPCGWIVHAAYMRAIDQLRREQHETAGGISDDVAAEATDETTPLPDEEALSHIEAEQLHRAMARLSTSQRQALSLYYFEGKTTRDGANALGWSEPTFRRRRDSAIRNLRKRFGVTVPEIDIGLAAWLSLTTSDGRLGWVAGNIGGPVEAIRAGAVAVGDRTREFAARLLSSGGGETAIGIGGPASKAAAGVCATAIAACTATGVIGPGLAGVDLIDHKTNSKHTIERSLNPQQTPRRSALAASSSSAADPESAQTDRSQQAERRTKDNRRSTSTDDAKQTTQQANQSAGSQFSVESAAPSTPAPSTPFSPPTSEPSPSPSPDQSAQQQFGLP